MFGNTQSSDMRQGRRGPARALLAGGFTTAVVAGSIFATAGTSNAASGWSRVAQCESGGNPSTDTGNGYYGLYQFDQQTWQSLGYSGTANQHSAAVQTQAAERLYAQRGHKPWPRCGIHLSGSANTSGSSSASRSYTRPALTRSHVSQHARISRTSGNHHTSGGVHSSRSYTRPALTRSHVSQHARISRTSGSESYLHHSYRNGVLGPWLIAERRSDVRAIQRKLTDKGYRLAIDGQFGRETEGVVKHFQAKAGITADGLCGPHTKAALFG